MITYKYQNILESDADVILHQVNCQGVMGSGVAKQIREKYPTVFKYYKQKCDMHTNNRAFNLGTAQIVFIDDNHAIGNLFAQERFGYDGRCYTDYDALKQALAFINQNYAGKTIAIPYLMGCHRGGGNWKTVFNIIEKTLVNCHVTIYEWGRNYDKCD